MKVSYLKNWDKEGTFYNQTITIDKETGAKFNNFVEKVLKQDKEKTSKTHTWSNEEMQREMYLKRLALGVNYTYLTTLNYFLSFIMKEPKENVKWRRIKTNRNTIIIVK